VPPSHGVRRSSCFESCLSTPDCLPFLFRDGMSAPVAGSPRPPTNKQINNQYPSAVLDHQFFINGSSSHLKATTKKRFTYLTPQGGMSIATKPKYGFNAAPRFCFISIRQPRTQRGAIWTTPRSLDDGSSLVHILKQILYFLFSFVSFVFPFVTPRRSEWTGSISSALGGQVRGIQEFPGLGSVASSFLSQLNIFF
jgi:hypothetical protein